MTLQLRNILVLLAILITAFVFAVSLDTPRTAAAAGAPFRQELAPSFAASKQDPTGSMRLIVETPALPACRPTDGSRGCLGRDSVTSDNLTWDSVVSVPSAGSVSNYATRPPD